MGTWELQEKPIFKFGENGIKKKNNFCIENIVILLCIYVLCLVVLKLPTDPKTYQYLTTRAIGINDLDLLSFASVRSKQHF